MFVKRWRIARLMGIPIYIDASWLIILALLTLSLGQSFPVILHEYYPQAVPATEGMYWAMAVVASLAFFLCILLHELGHAAVAQAQGAPIRGITLFVFGGVAEIGAEPASPGNEFLMAVAGPAVSLVIGLLCGALAWLGNAAAWPPPLVVVLAYLATINIAVLIFNVIPAFPLDGGQVLRSIVSGADRQPAHGYLLEFAGRPGLRGRAYRLRLGPDFPGNDVEWHLARPDRPVHQQRRP